MRKKSLGIVLAMLALISALLLSLVGCGEDQKPDDPTPTPPTTESGSEAGVYYFDASEDEEYLLTLGGTCQYTLAVKTDAESGTYTLADGTLTLTSGSVTRTAKLEDNVITLTYNDAQIRFLRKAYYTVSYNTDGGSAVASSTVMNGKTLKTPADPTKDGYVFLGWYTDASLKTPFAFAATPVTADTTLYARFVPKSADAKEYTVHYDLGYDGATLADALTIGGKLYDAATPVREGYTFVGWWMSDTANGAKLTARFVGAEESGATVFTEETTLYAVWQKADAATAAPAVTVNGRTASWDAVAGARAYLVTVTAPDGTVIVNAQRTTATTFTLTFTDPGEYKIEVVAANDGGSAISDVTTRYYTYLALPRVGDFFVTDSSVLVFRGAEGAEHYFITVDCGNPSHVHTAFDNGTSVCFNFSGCEMKKGGITFTVTATAKGRASSTATFTYERNLGAVENLVMNGGVLSWDAVSGASYYLVKIDDATFTVSGTELSLLSLASGDYTVSVTPVTRGFNSPDAATLTFTKATPAVPKNLRLVGTVLSWDAVPGAVSYEIKFAGTTFAAPEGATSVDLMFVDVALAEGSDYDLVLKVITNSGTAEKAVTVRYREMPDDLAYVAGKLTWPLVLGADTYEVQIEDGEIIEVKNGADFLAVDSLAKAGENTLRIRFKSGSFTSEWKEISVTAYAVSLDSRGGTEVTSLYKAIGDPMALPAPEREGYVFTAWYNVPGGAESNGRRYADPFFMESGEIVLYAYYTPKTYTLNLSAGDDSTTTASVSYGRKYKLPVPSASSATTSFGGWYGAPNGTGIAYTDPEGNSLSAWNFLDDNVTLYAFWVDNVLSFEKVGSGYAVSAGPRIDLVTSVTIPSEYRGAPVLTIVSGAFEGCDTLTEIRIPNTVTDIAEGAFDGCGAISAFTVYDAGERSPRYSSSDGVLFDSGTSDARHGLRPVFVPATMSGTYVIPAGTDVIPRRAFAETDLTKIVIPSSVREIGAEAFAECESLTSVVFENAGATSGVPALTIGERAFYKCTELPSIVLPARLGSIPLTRYLVVDGKIAVDDDGDVKTDGAANAFDRCDSLEDVSVAKGHNAKYTSVDGVLFGDYGATLLYFPDYKDVENYVIPDGVTKIAESAFAGCSHMTGSLTIPARISEIGTAAFLNATGLRSLIFAGSDFPADLQIRDYAFDGHRILSITFAQGSNVRTIGAYAFRFGGYSSEQSTQKNLVIPASVTSIGDGAFTSYGKLNVSFAQSTNTVTCGNGVFEDCVIGTLELPKNMTALPDFFYGLEVSNVVVDPENPAFISADGVLYTKSATGTPETLLLYPVGKTDTTFTVPDTVIAIAKGAFMGAGNLTSVTISSSVKTIGERAFYYTPYLTTVTISSSVTEIGKEAFAAYGTSGRYTRLTTVIFEEGGTEPLTIGERAFTSQTKLTAIVLPARANDIGDYAFYNTKAVAELSLGGVETIGSHAFDSCYYAGEVTFPATLKTIGSYAFAGSYYTYSKFAAFRFAEGSQLETIGEYAFQYGVFEEFTLPASVKKVYTAAFYSVKTLTTFTFEDGDTPLIFGAYDGDAPYYGVFGSTNIASLAFPARLVEIGASALRSVSSLKSVTFAPNGNLTTIGNGAFEYAGLTSVTIPATVKNTTVIGIGDNAFNGCPLTSVTFEASDEPLTIGESAFYVKDVTDKDGNLVTMTSITLPKRLTSFTGADGKVISPLANGGNVFNYSFASVTVEEGNAFYSTVDGILYNADKTALLFCPPAREDAVIIPASVKKIEEKAFKYCRNLASVTFTPGSVCEEIGASAFEQCYALAEITLPSGVKTLGDNVFKSCSALTTLVIPDSVTAIGASAFASCSNLRSLTLPSSMTVFDKSMIAYCNKLSELILTGGTSYKAVDNVLFTADGKTLIYYLPGLANTEYTVSEGVETIAEGAFSTVTTLNSVILPSTLKEIGKSAFTSCRNLTSVTFTPGTEPLVIGYNSFAYTSLTSVTIPARTTSIEASAFNGVKLTSLTFEAGSQLRYIGDMAFAGTSIPELDLPASLREMGDSVFARCSRLTSVNIPDGVVKIGESLFESCYSLESATLPSSLSELGNFTFKECSALQHVTFGKDIKITTLLVGTFTDCTSLESIELPASILEIPDADQDIPSYERNAGLFEGCSALRLVTFAKGSKCTKIGAYAFSGTAIESFTIPETVSAIGKEAFSSTPLVSVTIPNTVTSLGDNTFDQCSSLASVTLGNGVRALPFGIFQGCTSLREITLPASVTTVDSSAFNNVDDLTIHLDPDSRMNLLKGVLYDADWNICLFPSTITEYEIPRKVTKLPENFFDSYYGHGDQLTKITVEEGNTAFVSENGVLYTADKSQILFINSDVTTFELTKELLENIDEESLFDLLNSVPALQSVTVAEDVSGYMSIGGIVYTVDWEMAVVPSSLTEFVIPAALEEIPYGAFRNKTSLTTISAEARGADDPDLYIDMYAFSGCRSLMTVTLPGKIYEIDSYAFNGCEALKTLNLPYLTADDDLSDLLYAFNEYRCPALEAVNVAESEKYMSIDGVVFEYSSYDDAWIVAFTPVAKTVFTIPADLDFLPSLAGEAFTTVTFEKDADGNEVIGAAEGLDLDVQAFADMENLETVELPSRLTSIGEAAFAGCTIAEITIPDTILYVGASAFEGWTSEQTIKVGMTEADVTAEMELTDDEGNPIGIFDPDWLLECEATVEYKAEE